LAAENEETLNLKDKQGWQPIHEAARAGHLNVVEFLVEKGVDIHSRTNDGEGDTPLEIAVEKWGSDHPVSQYLSSLGAHDNYGSEL
jgi:ankyrin repeat protein